MRQSQEGRALRQFTLSIGKSASRNSLGRIMVFHLRLPILVTIFIVIGLLVTLLSALYASFFSLELDENPFFLTLTKKSFTSSSFMQKLIKIQQTPKYNTFDPNIFSIAKRIFKWKTHLWLINPQQEEAPLWFPKTLKKFNIWWRNMKITSTLASLKVFGRCLLCLGGQLVKRDTLGLGQNQMKTTLGRWVSIAWSRHQ